MLTLRAPFSPFVRLFEEGVPAAFFVVPAPGLCLTSMGSPWSLNCEVIFVSKKSLKFAMDRTCLGFRAGTSLFSTHSLVFSPCAAIWHAACPLKSAAALSPLFFFQQWAGGRVSSPAPLPLLQSMGAFRFHLFQVVVVC